jgi:glycosyltransferase involved in cell wall biosynthesis
MNILLVNHYAGSLRHGMEYRPYYFGREWARMGHHVTIAAASASHVRSIPPRTRGMITREMVDEIQYLWLKTPPYYGNGITRAINIFTFVGQLLLHQNRISRTAKPDVVIASSTYPLDVIAARAIARRSHAKLVFELHDLWPLSPVELGGMSRYHPFILLMQWAEDYACRHAAHVVSILPKTKAHLMQHGMAAEKFEYIPNGIDAEEWQGVMGELPEEHETAISRARSGGYFLVGYTGAHGLANALDPLVDTAFRIQEYPVRFLLIGQGPEKKNLMLKVQSRGQQNVIFLPPVGKPAIPKTLQNMDALYIGLKCNPLFRFGVSPNKMMDYMMAAKPVINAVRAGNDLAADSGCGISVSPEDPAEIARAILGIMNLPQKDRNEMGERGRAYVLANHNYRVLAGQFIAALGKIHDR